MALSALKTICPPGCVDEQFNSRVIAAATDLALVVDPAGVIKDVAVGDAAVRDPSWSKLVGRRWVDTIAPDSQNKVEELLQETRSGAVPRARQINQHTDGPHQKPFRFSAVLDGKAHVVALGRDLSALQTMQQELVASQQAMDREVQRLRHAETRYRLLLQTTNEGVVVVDGATLKLVEANQAAATLLQATTQALVGQPFESLFEQETAAAVETLMRWVQSGGRPSEIQVRLASGHHITLSGSLFRQSSKSLLFFRLRPDHDTTSVAPRDKQLLLVVNSIPDSFVVIGEDKRILCANTAFCDLVQQPNENLVVGQPLERWLGRPGVDLNLMLASLREHGELRNFATIVRGEYGTTQEAVASGVAAMTGQVRCNGFSIRPVSMPRTTSSLEPMPRSLDQLRDLVGRVPLKEIVRESADLIERLCIEVALQVSGDNRASAAQLLGLSRQGLYSKLRRYGIGDLTD